MPPSPTAEPLVKDVAATGSRQRHLRTFQTFVGPGYQQPAGPKWLLSTQGSQWPSIRSHISHPGAFTRSNAWSRPQKCFVCRFCLVPAEPGWGSYKLMAPHKTDKHSYWVSQMEWLMTAWPHPAPPPGSPVPTPDSQGDGKGGHMVRLMFVFQVLCQGDHLRLRICYT